MELEDALQQAHHTISFLHGCLTSDGYKYAYPEQTEQRLAEIKRLLPKDMPWGCYHSYYCVDCDMCVAGKSRRDKKRELGAIELY